MEARISRICFGVTVAIATAVAGCASGCRGHGAGAAGGKDATTGADQSPGADQPGGPEGTGQDTAPGTPTMMLYYSGSGGPGRGIGLATSTDGINFTRHPANPVLGGGPPGSFDKGVTDPSILVDNGTFYLYYTAQSATMPEQIGLATSKDGVTFTRHPASPVIKAGPEAWDAAKASDPTVVVHEGRFVCFYSSEPKGGAEATSMATSSDGIVWTKSVLSPVLTDGHDPSARRATVGGGAERWAIYYGRPTGAGVAFSDDLVTFTPRPDPVLSAAADVEIVTPGAAPFDRFHLYFGGSSGGASGIGVARSGDGIVFERNPSLILVSAPDGFEGGKISDPTVVIVRR